MSTPHQAIAPTTHPEPDLTPEPAPVLPPECDRCGTWTPRRGRPPRCPRCRILTRLEKVAPAVLTNPELQPLVEHLVANPNPARVVNWLAPGGSVKLLNALALGDIPLTHEGLHAWPTAPAVQHLRHMLIACGVLPAVDPHLIDFERWLHQRLITLSGHPHETLLHRFAVWHQLPRLRANAAIRPLRPTARSYASDQFVAATVLLTWLHERQIEPHELTQPVLLRRYLNHDDAPLIARTAACLMLLYAQPVSRILRLTHDALLYVDGELHLRFGEPASPAPEPITALIEQLIDDNERRGRSGRWLFPGRVPDQPLAYRTLITALQRLDFPLMEARAAALRELVQQAPAPVIAAALGFHHTTTTRQSRHAGIPWSRYPTSRS